MAPLLVLQLAVLACAYAHAWIDLAIAPRLPREPRLPSPAPRLAVVVPARDEEANIGACLGAIEAQDLGDLEIVVADDGSTDGTAEIVRERAARDPRVRLIPCPERPPGWQGKSWALTAGVRATEGAWIAMIDADVVLGPRALERALALAVDRRVKLLSLLPALRDLNFWERVIQPVIGMFVFLCQPLWRARAPRSSVVVANGQFLLVERAAYLAAGGHEAVKGEIVEDVELARAWKRLGLPLLLAPAFADLEVRMYRGFAGIWRGWGKTIHPYLARHPFALWVGIAPLLAIFLLPFFLLPASLLHAPWAEMATAEAAAVILIVGNAMAFRRAIRHEVIHGLFWPLAMVVLVALFAARTAAALRGEGVTWKGRRYGRRAR